MNPVIIEIIASFVRWVLANAASFLIARGIWSQADAGRYTEFLVSGITLGLISLALAVWSTFKKRQKLVTALSTPHPQTEEMLQNTISQGGAASVTTPKDEIPVKVADMNPPNSP